MGGPGRSGATFSTSLAENGLTNQDAAGILGSTCEQRQHRLYVDLAYNAVNSTSQLGPRGDITLNIGPAWSRAEAEHALSGSNVNARARSWRRYMSGPTTLLARTIDKSRLKPWRCPLCKCEVAAMSLGDGSRISIGSSVAMHVKGKKHLGALQAALGDGASDPPPLRFVLDGSSSYQFNALTGCEGLRHDRVVEETEASRVLAAQDCDVNKPAF